jgi:hypothetical protein
MPPNCDYTTNGSYIEVWRFGSQTFSHQQFTRFGSTCSIPQKGVPALHDKRPLTANMVRRFRFTSDSLFDKISRI